MAISVAPHTHIIERAGGMHRKARSHCDLAEISAARTDFVLITSGWAVRCESLPDGREQILDILIPGDVTILADKNVDKAQFISTRTAMSYFAVSRHQVGELLRKCPDSASQLMELLSEESRRLARHVVRLGRGRAEEKIASLILELHGRLARRGLIQETSFFLPLSQQDLADLLGMTLVHLNRILRRLAEERILCIRWRSVEIRNLSALVALAGPLGESFAQLQRVRPVAPAPEAQSRVEGEVQRQEQEVEVAVAPPLASQGRQRQSRYLLYRGDRPAAAPRSAEAPYDRVLSPLRRS
jgi:CRP/FNR family transcriptional regulator